MDNMAVSGANVQAQVLQAAGVYAMKVANNVTASTMMTLLSSVQPATYNNPPNLGNSIDVKA
ncbi:putative motility protein [Chitinivorax sp. B]|uniref:putative motility protein n=1 Tax=Chitinivorax sp. B TaxID=2502235 RepID=UPI0010F55158|nr:putative motility protein [Chitinivorax sp. B]